MKTVIKKQINHIWGFLLVNWELTRKNTSANPAVEGESFYMLVLAHARKHTHTHTEAVAIFQSQVYSERRNF